MNSLSKFVSNSFHTITDFRTSKNQTFVQDNSLIFEAIPKEVFIYEIFSRLVLEEWFVLSQVNKSINSLLSNPVLLKEKIYREKTFNPEDWGTYFGNLCLGASDGNLAFQSMPDDIGQIWKGRSPTSKYKKFGQTHVVVWIPSSLSLDKYKDLLAINSPLNTIKPGNLGSRVMNQYGRILTKKAEWVVMPRKRAFASPYSYKIVDFKTLAIPKTLEAIICMTTTFLKFAIKSSKFKYSPIVCQEGVKFISTNDIARTYQIMVHFTSSGVSIDVYDPIPRGPCIC